MIEMLSKAIEFDNHPLEKALFETENNSFKQSVKLIPIQKVNINTVKIIFRIHRLCQDYFQYVYLNVFYYTCKMD